MKHFIIGGNKSGKSALAERIASNSKLPVTYIATSRAGDNEMQRRILNHQASRPEHWALIEEPSALANIIRENSQNDSCLLIDCISMWITNLILADKPQQLELEISQFLRELEATQATIVMVSNESGLGVIPLGKLSRQYLDQLGIVHQQIAKLSDRVAFIVAGLPMYLKGEQNAV